MNRADAGWERVFVYGSLKRGERNAQHMGSSTLIGAARTKAAYSMVDLGGYPALVANGNSQVDGEVYLVPPAQLAHLDWFEDHPSVYERTLIELADGTSAHAYLLPAERVEGRPLIEATSWTGRTR